MCGFGNVRTHGDDVRRQTAHFCAVVDSGTILAEAERHIHRQKERETDGGGGGGPSISQRLKTGTVTDQTSKYLNMK